MVSPVTMFIYFKFYGTERQFGTVFKFTRFPLDPYSLRDPVTSQMEAPGEFEYGSGSSSLDRTNVIMRFWARCSG
jgi:hypothetical protein